MPFSDTIRIEALQKAGYACCICHQNVLSVEVHHIIPEASGGQGTIENAMALCPNCHSDYGGNPEKRKRMKEIRDFWYRQIHDTFKPKEQVLIQQISKDLVTKSLPEIKKALKEFVDYRIQEITSDTALPTVSSIIGSIASVSASPSPSHKEVQNEMFERNRRNQYKNSAK